MKVKFIDGPRKGIEKHERNDTARTLIAAGFAVEVPLPPRASREWFAARQELSRVSAGIGDASHDTPVPVLTPGWSITKRGPRDEFFLQEVTAAGETILYDPEKGVPDACPAKVKNKFLEMRGAPERNVGEETEIAKRKQLDYELSISDAKRY